MEKRAAFAWARAGSNADTSSSRSRLGEGVGVVEWDQAPGLPVDHGLQRPPDAGRPARVWGVVCEPRAAGVSARSVNCLGFTDG